MERGPLNPSDSFKLDRNRDKFEKYLEPDDVLGKLIALNVIDDDDHDSVKNVQPPTRVNRVTTLMKIIKAKGTKAYPRFIEALKYAKYEFLIEALNNTSAESKSKDEPPSKRTVKGPTKEEIPQRIKQKRVDSKFLSKISGAVGMGWEHIALGLNMTQVQIDHAKLDNPHNASLQFYSCLSKWFNSQPNATYGHLYCVLSEKRDMVPMEWDVIMKALAAAADS